MLHEEVELYSRLTGKDGYKTPIGIIGAYLDGYEKGKAEAQPEIIHCQNCKFYQSNFHWCKLLDSEFSLTDFCSYGERGTNERAD